MATQKQHDYGFLRGFIQAIKEISRREALGQAVTSDTPGGYAEKLQKQGFHRGASITDIQINRMAQYLYEGISITPEITLIMDMTSKATLVKVLTEALTRAGVAVTKEED